MADNFRESSLQWVGQKFLRRTWEALEYRFNQMDWPELPELPQWEPPQWLGEYGLVLVAIALFAGLFYLSWWLFRLIWRLFERYSDRLSNASGHARLPEEANLIPGTVASWLAQAQDYHQAQRYGEACRSLYFAMLLKLDEAEIVPQQPSRTDREYLYLTQELPHPDAPQLLLETHERLCFSRFSASEELFQHCLSAFDRIEQQVEALLQTRSAVAVQAQSASEASQ